MSYFYLVSRCRKDDTLYGSMHGSNDADKTLCGHEIDCHWWILNAEKWDRENIDCKKCLKAMAKEGVKYASE